MWDVHFSTLSFNFFFFKVSHSFSLSTLDLSTCLYLSTFVLFLLSLLNFKIIYHKFMKIIEKVIILTKIIKN